jgi:hypothetical protein
MLLEAAEKRDADARTARLLQSFAFTPEDGELTRAVLRRIAASDNEKEARLASERIRDELGLTRVVKPTEQTHIHVTVEPFMAELAQRVRTVSNTRQLEPPRLPPSSQTST